MLDTNVLVAAFRSKRGASYELVRSIGRADWRLNVSVALALEYEDVLKRNGMLQGITEPEIDDFLDYVSAAYRGKLKGTPPKRALERHLGVNPDALDEPFKRWLKATAE